MIFRKAKNLAAGVILAVTPLVTLAMPGIAHAATFNCVWTGATDSTFADATNWSGCNSDFPQTADQDDLVFPTDTVTNLAITIPAGYTFSSISFSGTGGAGGYDLSGSNFTLAGDVTDTSDQDNNIDNAIALSGTSTITVPGGDLLTLNGTISGTGAIVKAGAGSLKVSDITSTGALTINAGDLGAWATSSADLTVSSVTIASGATFNYDPFDFSGVTTYTIAKPITSAGSFNFSAQSGTALVLNLTGTITLTGNSEIQASTNETIHIQGPLHGPGFKLTTSGGGVVLNESTDNNTDTPSGNIAAVAGAAAAPAPAATPATPDTGFALVAARPGVTLAITLAAAGAILVAARMARKTPSRR